jgi:small nuclear ribonucleoprotein E
MACLARSGTCRPINLIFRYLQSKQVIQIWLYDQADLRIEGRIIGFDEYMNLVLEDAAEVGMSPCQLHCEYSLHLLSVPITV